MGNVAVGSVQNKNNTTNFFDTSSIKEGATLGNIKKDSKIHSLFMAIDKNKDGKIDEKEFKSFKSMDEKDIGKIIVISPIIEVKRILKVKEISKKLLEKEIEKREEKIAELLAMKKLLKHRNILLAVGTGAIAGLAKIILGSNIAFLGCTAIGVLALTTIQILRERKIDAKIADLKAEIAFLKSAHLLIS